MKRVFSNSGPGMRDLGRALLIVLVILAPRVIACQPSQFDRLLSEGRQALAAREHEKALRTFNSGFDAASEVGDTKWQGDFLFYLGLTLQEKAKEMGEGREREELLERAIRYYEQALEFQPGSGGAANNLAQVYSQFDMMDEAIESFQRAVDLRDSRHTFYKLNLADLLASTGKQERAIALYNSVLEEQPENSRAHRSLSNLYLSEEPEQLLAYLWRLIGNGLVLRAQETTLRTIEERVWTRSQREELLTILVATLSKQFYHPAQFEATDAGVKLREIRQKEDMRDVRAGIGELMRIHHLDDVQSYRFAWWLDRVNHWEEPKRGMWPADAFRMLIRSLGDWCQQAGDMGSAETYYFLALTLDRTEPDPEAFLRLAELYLAQGDFDKVERTAEEYIGALFYGKAEAYRHSQTEKIYGYHRALGMIYAHIGRWGNRHEPASAIFQLEHAVDTAMKLNQEPDITRERVKLEPQLVDSLAKGYEIIGQPSLAFRKRVDVAEMYLATRDTAYARQVLEPFVDSRPPPGVSVSEEERFNRLREEAFGR
jgi:tetratricopeptide (TPR) repeat protein